MANTLTCIPMVNELSFTRLKSSLLESLKILCEHDISFAKIWQFVHALNKQMQSSSPSSKTRVIPERLFELLTRREASFDLEQSNETFGCKTR